MLKNWDFLIAEMWGLLAVAALLTFTICWFVWGRSAVRANIQKVKKLEDDLSTARSALTQSRADVQRAERKQEELKDRMMREQAKFAEFKKEQAERPNNLQMATQNLKSFIDKRKAETMESKMFEKTSDTIEKAKNRIRDLLNRG